MKRYSKLLNLPASWMGLNILCTNVHLTWTTILGLPLKSVTVDLCLYIIIQMVKYCINQPKGVYNAVSKSHTTKAQINFKTLLT